LLHVLACACAFACFGKTFFLTNALQDFVDQMPVGCFLPHAYDPIPLEFREQERIGENNELELSQNPIGEAHGVFYHESDIISRAEVGIQKNTCECIIKPKPCSILLFICRFGLQKRCRTTFPIGNLSCQDCGCGG
jgi:hypothetical protein